MWQVRQGLLYVWGEGGGTAEADSAETEPPVSSFRDEHESSGDDCCLTKGVLSSSIRCVGAGTGVACLSFGQDQLNEQI